MSCLRQLCEWAFEWNLIDLLSNCFVWIGHRNRPSESTIGMSGVTYTRITSKMVSSNCFGLHSNSLNDKKLLILIITSYRNIRTVHSIDRFRKFYSVSAVCIRPHNLHDIEIIDFFNMSFSWTRQDKCEYTLSNAGCQSFASYKRTNNDKIWILTQKKYHVNNVEYICKTLTHCFL